MNRRRTFPALLVLALWAGAAAADAPPQPPASALGLIRDMRLTLLARRALAAEPSLDVLRLGVEVRGGVATVWGEVPSADAARLAVVRLEAIDGVYEVRSELIGGRGRPRPDVVLSVPSYAPKRIEVEAAKPFTESAAPARPQNRAVIVGGEGKNVARPRTMPEAGPLLLPTPPPPDPSVPTPANGRKERPEAPVNASPVREAVARAKASQLRFRSIPVEVRGDMVYIGRGEADDADVAALREMIRRIRGVGGVVLTGE